MDLAFGRNGCGLGNSVVPARQAIMSALERHPALEARNTVARSVRALDGGVVSVDNDDDGRHWPRADLAQQAVDVLGDAIDVIVRVHLAEAGRLHVSLSIVRPDDRQLVHAAAATPR